MTFDLCALLRAPFFAVLALSPFLDAVAAEPYDARGDLVDAGAAVVRDTPTGLIRGNASFALIPGHVYATASDRADILQIGLDGVPVASRQIPGYSMGFKGTAFGPDGSLYVVAPTNAGYDVLTIHANGEVRLRMSGPDYVFGNLSYGKIAVTRDKTVYVGGQNVLRRYRPNSSTGDVVFQTNQVYDVDLLPNGNLLVASAYELHELTADGGVVREIAGQQLLTDIRGVIFRPESNDIFVTMLGHSSNFFRIMRVDAATGTVEASESFHYADDMTFLPNGSLLVGSRTQAPGRFTTDLVARGNIATDERMFVTRMPEPLNQFADGFE